MTASIAPMTWLSPGLRIRFRLRTLLLGGPLLAALWAWSATRPLEEVEAWIVVEQTHRPQASSAKRPAKSLHWMAADFETALKRTSLITEALTPPQIAVLPVVQRQSDAAGWLRDALQVELHAESGLVRISLRGSHPEQLSKILHSVAATYARRRGQ